MAAEHLYSCFDFRLRSELALELTAASDDGEREVVTIRRGPVPEMLPGAGPQERGIQVAGDAVLLTVEGVARYLVTGGREIVVDQVPGGSDRMFAKARESGADVLIIDLEDSVAMP